MLGTRQTLINSIYRWFKYGGRSSPFWRSWFIIFFIYSLLDIIQRSAKERGYQGQYPAGLFAGLYITLVLLGNASGRLPETSMLGWYMWWVPCLTPFLLFKPLGAIRYVHESGNIDLEEDEKVTVGQVVLCLLGVVYWVLVIVGAFLT
jgi:hypothetical protein